MVPPRRSLARRAPLRPASTQTKRRWVPGRVFRREAGGAPSRSSRSRSRQRSSSRVRPPSERAVSTALRGLVARSASASRSSRSAGGGGPGEVADAGRPSWPSNSSRQQVAVLAVDQRRVGLGDQGETPAGEVLEEPQLPQRPRRARAGVRTGRRRTPRARSRRRRRVARSRGRGARARSGDPRPNAGGPGRVGPTRPIGDSAEPGAGASGPARSARRSPAERRRRASPSPSAGACGGAPRARGGRRRLGSGVGDRANQH